MLCGEKGLAEANREETHGSMVGWYLPKDRIKRAATWIDNAANQRNVSFTRYHRRNETHPRLPKEHPVGCAEYARG